MLGPPLRPPFSFPGLEALVTAPPTPHPVCDLPTKEEKGDKGEEQTVLGG